MIRGLSHKNNAHIHAAKQQGAFLFGLIVVVIILSGLYSVLIERAWRYRVQYEKAEVAWTTAAIQTALQTEYARLRLMGRPVPILKGENPLRFLSRMPLNYEGELCHPDVYEFKGGNWYFDTCDKRLVYVFSSEKFFAREYPIVLQFKVESFRLLTEPAKPIPIVSKGKNIKLR